MDIYLKQAILQVIDRTVAPIYSQLPLDLTNGNTRDYLISKIKKLSSAQSKTGTLRQESALVPVLRQLPEDFIAMSQQLVEKWYTVYQASDDAPSADVFVVLYEVDTVSYVAFLKVNYHQSYTHYVNAETGELENQLITHQAILSGKTQKADEGFTVSLADLTFELMEKQYTFSGEKMAYLSTKVIESEPAPSLEENVKAVKKAAEKIGKQFEVAKHDVVANVKEAVYETIEEQGEINPQVIAEKVFKDNISAQTAFKTEVIEKAPEASAPVSPAVQAIAEKKYGKQKLKLSNGIELIVPIDVYHNPDLFEFINHPDGTMSVSIKNVEEVISRL